DCTLNSSDRNNLDAQGKLDCDIFDDVFGSSGTIQIIDGVQAPRAHASVLRYFFHWNKDVPLAQLRRANYSGTMAEGLLLLLVEKFAKPRRALRAAKKL